MKRILWFVVIFIVLLVGYIVYCSKNIDKFAVNKQITLEISKGISNKDIIKLLSEKVDLNFVCQFVLYQKVKGKNLKRGIYTFSTGENIKKIIDQLEKGPPANYVRFTIYPGWTKYDIAQVLSGSKQKEVFLSLMTDEKFISNLKKQYKYLGDFGDIKSLEGFLYPDTYFFRPDDLKSLLFPQLLIKTSLKKFGEEWIDLWDICQKDTKCNPYKLSPYEILILASIVVKEEKNKENKAKIADILIRRYKNYRLIGADWTLCYGLGIPSKNCYKNINYSTLNDKRNLYNTRANKGLPPTPVGNPTIEDIKAVLYPEKNEYWYYLHDKSGKIHFGKDLNEHLSNKAKYLSY